MLDSRRMSRSGAADRKHPSPPLAPPAPPPGPVAALTVRDYWAIALVSAAVLLLEIAATRILSVVLWYHFAFLSISLAMLGLAAPGVLFALRPPSEKALPAVMLAAAVTLPGCVIAVFKLGRPLREAGRLFPGLASVMNSGLMLLIVAVLVPMLCLGAAVCLLLLRAPGRRIAGLYAADLVGATAAAIAIVPLMSHAPTPLIVAGAGFLPLAAVALVRPGLCVAAAAMAVVLAGLMVWGEPFRLHYAKEYAERGDVLYERWTPTARITVFPSPFFTPRPAEAFGWGFGANYVPVAVDQLWIEQDGAAGTPITRVASPATLDSLDHLFYDVTSLAQQLNPVDRVCIIGAGGGRDILTALKAGARDVDAVELNPCVIEALSTRFAAFSGDVYHLPGVHAVASEGRSFLTRSRGGYDLVQISLIDSWAATSAGAFALSENYLYTTEAVGLYWSRLTPRGTISISRYAATDRISESLRLTLLARRALEVQGVAEPTRHLAIAQGDRVATVLLMREPVDAAWFARFDTLCAARGFERLWPIAEGEAPQSVIARLLSAPAGELSLPGLDLSPPRDDRPFFFQTVPVFGQVNSAALSKWSTNENSVLLLRGLLVLMPLLAAALLLLPFPFAGRFVRGADFWRGSAYFAAIGLAFMFVEGSWIQRFILYLGHPSHATTVALATLLLAAGGGAGLAGRMPLARVQRAALLLPLVVVAIGFAAGPLFRATIGAAFPLRVIASVALLAPAGALMGFAFPAGMERFGDPHKAWYWALNGVAGVVAIVWSLALAMTFGLVATGMIGAACYLVAASLIQGPRAATGTRE